MGKFPVPIKKVPITSVTGTSITRGSTLIGALAPSLLHIGTIAPKRLPRAARLALSPARFPACTPFLPRCKSHCSRENGKLQMKWKHGLCNIRRGAESIAHRPGAPPKVKWAAKFYKKSFRFSLQTLDPGGMTHHTPPQPVRRRLSKFPPKAAPPLSTLSFALCAPLP